MKNLRDLANGDYLTYGGVEYVKVSHDTTVGIIDVKDVQTGDVIKLPYLTLVEPVDMSEVDPPTEEELDEMDDEDDDIEGDILYDDDNDDIDTTHGYNESEDDIYDGKMYSGN